jgi:hypothetical protein
MTLPFERTRAVLNTRLFLTDMLRPGHVLKRDLRLRALRLLKHYPTELDMEDPVEAFGKRKKR